MPLSLSRYIPVTLVMGMIFFLSHQPGDALDLPDLPQVDKVAHVLMYAVLGLTALFAIQPGPWLEKPFVLTCGVVLFCLIYGLTDEIHQSFIPGRFASGWDLLADATGGALAVTALYCWRFRRPRPS